MTAKKKPATKKAATTKKKSASKASGPLTSSITEVRLERTFNIGNFESVRIGVASEVVLGEDAEAVFDRLKGFIEEHAPMTSVNVGGGATADYVLYGPNGTNIGEYDRANDYIEDLKAYLQTNPEDWSYNKKTVDKIYGKVKNEHPKALDKVKEIYQIAEAASG